MDFTSLRTFQSILVISLIGTVLLGAAQGFSQQPGLLALHEAEILIYLIPPAQAVRSEGMDVGWEQSSATALNQADYFFFWVYNSIREGTGSVTIGHYAVNKHTADVWDVVSDQMVESAELKGIQRILRKAHGIGEDAIRTYRMKPLWSQTEEHFSHSRR